MGEESGDKEWDTEDRVIEMIREISEREEKGGKWEIKEWEGYGRGIKGR